MLQTDYQVSLDAFCGPLDLLLFLIRRAEVDIHSIRIAAITDQYLEFLRRVEAVDIDVAGEFLVMAATLIEIKSRTLSPPPDGSAEGETSGEGGGEIDVNDPRAELIQQLLAFQRFRVASEQLEERRLRFLQRFPRRPARPEGPAESAEPVELELDDVHALDLSEAYEHIMASIDFNRLGDHTVEVDDTPIALFQEDLLDQLLHSSDRCLLLQSAFAGQSRSQRVGLFLATLELVRLRRVTVRQDDPDDEIQLELLDEAATGPA